MYTPRSFREQDESVLLDLMNRYSFATLVSSGPDGLVATHLPFVVESRNGQPWTLIGHMARANRQWRSFDGDAEVLVCFLGPHAYVSPSWYQDPVTVPTWNYAAVHVHGVPRVVTDPDRLRSQVEHLAAIHEAYVDPPWDVANAATIIDAELKAIVGIEIPVRRVEGKLKLSQNRSLADRNGVAAALERDDDTTRRAVAALMRRERPE